MKRIEWNLLKQLPEILELTPEEERTLGKYEVDKINNNIYTVHSSLEQLIKDLNNIRYDIKRKKKNEKK